MPSDIAPGRVDVPGRQFGGFRLLDRRRIGGRRISPALECQHEIPCVEFAIAIPIAGRPTGVADHRVLILVRLEHKDQVGRVEHAGQIRIIKGSVQNMLEQRLQLAEIRMPAAIHT